MFTYYARGSVFFPNEEKARKDCLEYFNYSLKSSESLKYAKWIGEMMETKEQIVPNCFYDGKSERVRFLIPYVNQQGELSKISTSYCIHTVNDDFNLIDSEITPNFNEVKTYFIKQDDDGEEWDDEDEEED